MKSVIAVLIFFILQQAQGAATASIVTCRGSTQGTFTLDYLHMMKELGYAPQLKQHDVFMSGGLLQYAGFYGLSLSATHLFLSSRAQPNDYSQFNVWQEAAFGFDAIPVDKFSKIIPDSCQPVDNKMKPILFLKNSPNNRVITYDSKITSELKKNDPIQYQLLLMRIWLTEFTDNDDLIYAIIRLWNSDSILTDKKVLAEFQRQLQLLILSQKKDDSVCERSQYILENFRRILHKNCDQINAKDLANIQDLEILDNHRSIIIFDNFELRKIDLSGLSSIRSFNASNVLWFGVPYLKDFSQTSHHYST